MPGNEKGWKVDLSRQKWMVWKEHPISFAAKTCVLVPSITPSGELGREYCCHRERPLVRNRRWEAQRRQVKVCAIRPRWVAVIAQLKAYACQALSPFIA